MNGAIRFPCGQEFSVAKREHTHTFLTNVTAFIKLGQTCRYVVVINELENMQTNKKIDFNDVFLLNKPILRNQYLYGMCRKHSYFI